MALPLRKKPKLGQRTFKMDSRTRTQNVLMASASPPGRVGDVASMIEIGSRAVDRIAAATAAPADTSKPPTTLPTTAMSAPRRRRKPAGGGGGTVRAQ